jgi:hypothetical protein
MSALRPIRVDVSGFPLVVHTFDGKQTDDDIDAYLRECAQVYARRQPFVAITYIRDYAMTWSHIGRIGAGMKQLPMEYCRGAALIVPFPTFRFLLSSFYLITKPPHPIVVFDDVQAGEAWVRQKLGEEGMPIPPSLRFAG